MDMKQIRYFLALAEEESFSRAADVLNLSQPALSIAIRKLEEELGVELFYTFDRKQHLTDEGLRLLKGARELSDMFQKTVEDVSLTDSFRTGEFTLGLSPLFGACFFGDLIPSFSAAYPDIKINMIEDGANRINQRIENGTVDLAVTLKTEQISAFSSCHFSTQRNVVLLHKSHPLAHRETLTVADLKDDAFAIFNSDFILHRQIMSACRSAGFRPKIALLSSQWDFMAELVSRNRAVSILPKPMMDRHPNPNIRCIPLTDSMKYWDISLAWHPQKYMPKACRTFLQYVTENLPPDDL